jgi:hypothetical protein
MSHSDQAADGARWMTFAELAAIRGTSKRAAVTLIRRHGWRRQRNNEGHVIALVPPTWATPEQANGEAHDDDHREPDSEGHSEAHATPFHSKALAALEVAMAEANARAENALALADRSMALLADAETRADRAERAVAGERARADVLRDRLDAAERGRREAQDAADQAHRQTTSALEAAEELRQANEARKARGRMWRVLAAWRRE